MLRKLLKHEFHATARIMLPLYLILLVTAVGGNVSIRVMDYSDNDFLNVLGGLMLFAFGIAIAGVCIMSLMLMIQRFYKNLMGDEGYVMFTLPVSVHQHIWSKLIVSSVWFIVTGVAVALAGLILVADVSFLSYGRELLQELFGKITAYYALNGAAIFAELMILVFFGCTAACLQFYASMAMGHSFANHKNLLSVAFFFASQFVLQFLGSMLLFSVESFGFFYNWSEALSPMQDIHLFMGLLILGTLVYSAIFYAVTTIMLKKRLNLE